MKATVIKQKRGRGKQPAYAVKLLGSGNVIQVYEDNGKMGGGSARDLAQAHARRLNRGDNE